MAAVFMLIDHIGAVLIREDHPAGSLLFILYYACRLTGELSFPIFAFLLTEGFSHTHDLKKYLLRVGIFALLSEIPFDLAMSGKLFDPHKQNILFTFFLCLLLLEGLKKIREGGKGIPEALPNRLLFSICLAVFAGLVSFFARFDYDFTGPVFVAILYLNAAEPVFRAAAASAWMFLYGEPTAFLAFLPLAGYNGEKGKSGRYFFYLFYPLHLLLLWLIKILVTG